MDPNERNKIAREILTCWKQLNPKLKISQMLSLCHKMLALIDRYAELTNKLYYSHQLRWTLENEGKQLLLAEPVSDNKVQLKSKKAFISKLKTSVLPLLER